MTAEWDFGLANDVLYHKISRQDQQVFSEFNDRAEWGNFVSHIKALAMTLAKPFSTMPLTLRMPLRISPVLTMMFGAAL